jgi:hypothetical protein
MIAIDIAAILLCQPKWSRHWLHAQLEKGSIKVAMSNIA